MNLSPFSYRTYKQPAALLAIVILTMAGAARASDSGGADAPASSAGAHVNATTGDPANAVTRTTRDRLMMAGFGEVAVLAGGAQAAAA